MACSTRSLLHADHQKVTAKQLIVMAVAVKKYNPGFLTDEQIIESFCVRTSEFEAIIESLRDAACSSNPHTIVIGPRGSGKTHLLMRVAAEVRRDETLKIFFPIIFPEESYEVSTCGEFWLECLHHLSQQAPAEERNNLELTHDDLRIELNDQVLAERCLGALLDFADRHDKRLLLVVENLNMLFNEIGDPEVGWQLRKTLQTERRIMLLASATSRFNEIDDPTRAMYDLFRVISLRPLDTHNCATLWRVVSGSPTTLQNVRPLEILTGGNPRLITIIATFGSGRSFQELMDSLLDLVDDHTEYFKSHLEHLPPQERRVYLALARLWKPATTKEVADLARTGTNQCSSLLKRLTDRGVVTIEGGTPRRRQFYLTERLYNIYYLLRRGGGTHRVINALIEFMVSWYSPNEMWELVERTYLYASTVGTACPDIFEPVAAATLDNARQAFERGDREEAITILAPLANLPKGLAAKEMRVLQVVALSYQAAMLSIMGRTNETIDVSDSIIDLYGSDSDVLPPYYFALALLSKGVALIAAGEVVTAISVLDDALSGLASVGRKMVNRSVDVEEITALLAKSLALWKIEETHAAISILDALIAKHNTSTRVDINGRVVDVLVSKTLILDDLGRTISRDEFTLLLTSVAKTGLRDKCIDAMLCFVGRKGPAIGLQLIQESGAAEVLLPLVTALQQELGLTPRVAKEVEEVAKDIRLRLAEDAERRGDNWNSSRPVPASN